MNNAMSKQYDVIIIGAGHNGLVCANALAEKGQRVLVLEANDQVGGMAITREFAKGYRASAISHLLYGLHPRAQQYAPALYANDDSPLTPVDTIMSNTQGDWVKLEDSTRWSKFNDEMKGFSSVLYQLSDQVPPRLKETGLNDIKALLGAGWQARKLKQEGVRKLLRIIGMNVYDLADESFDDTLAANTSSNGASADNDLLKSALCFESIIGTRLGPRAPNTVYNWLNRRAIIDQLPSGVCSVSGGMGAVSEALAQHAVAQGVEIRTHSAVIKILVEDNRATGVQLEGGEEILADLLISNADIKTTMLGLVGPQIVETQVVRKVNHIPMQGSTAKIHIALNELPSSFTGDQADLNARIICADTHDGIERASNGIKYGEFAEQLPFEVSIASIDDPSLAPEGKHVMSVLIPYVPYENRIGWATQKTKFKNQMMNQLEALLPGTKAAASKVEVLLPSDIEAQCNVTGGHWHHGEIGLERFMMLRPTSGFGQYETSVNNLYLCGADCHPGGDVNGAAGLNAARAILRRTQS
ncbi:MAG: phytoene dehydrogenase-like protein [Saprospiraceae bacterium]|jgi:phytoene dehydrogenase-like protein